MHWLDGLGPSRSLSSRVNWSTLDLGVKVTILGLRHTVSRSWSSNLTLLAKTLSPCCDTFLLCVGFRLELSSWGCCGGGDWGSWGTFRFLNCFCSEIDWDNTIWGERALSWVREVFFLGCISAWGDGLWFWLKMVEPKPGGNSGLGFFV